MSNQSFYGDNVKKKKKKNRGEKIFKERKAEKFQELDIVQNLENTVNPNRDK